MSDLTPEPGFQLDPDRVEEIRLLHVRLTGLLPEAEPPVRELLDEIHTALTELLDDRDSLVRANHQAGEDLARWLGHI
ncbi:hypothetical protein ACKI1J_32180 [Streptomyces scabiei]|uniref:hypothetical protein n=1 Tax=Streptomyces scabiei TaxID=1930 RepID=UPI0039F14B71